MSLKPGIPKKNPRLQIIAIPEVSTLIPSKNTESYSIMGIFFIFVGINMLYKMALGNYQARGIFGSSPYLAGASP